MELVNVLRRALTVAAEVTRWGAGIEAETRESLLSSLRNLCGDVDAAFESALTSLIPIGNLAGEPERLARALHQFAGDSDIRRQFSSESINGPVGLLLTRLSSNIDSLRYPIDFRRIDGLRRYLRQFGVAQGGLFPSYDEFADDLDRLASDLLDSRLDREERIRYIRRVLDQFAEELWAAQSEIRVLTRPVEMIVPEAS